MKTTLHTAILFLCLLILNACKIGPSPINYGSDICQFCSMTIIDKQHGSELVTQKGKVYKFDSVECLLNYSKNIDQAEVAMFLFNHFDQPGELISSENASFLISEGIPSPMGAYLTAFDSRESATEAMKRYGGSLFYWDELQEYWKNHYVYYE